MLSGFVGQFEITRTLSSLVRARPPDSWAMAVGTDQLEVVPEVRSKRMSLPQNRETVERPATIRSIPDEIALVSATAAVRLFTSAAKILSVPWAMKPPSTASMGQKVPEGAVSSPALEVLPPPGR